ncbi:MAG: XkdF-like putative serine protease domain-containing protein [Candidatus Methanosuratincola petrocarbonis]
MGKIKKAKGPTLTYPEKPNEPKRFVCQNHWRGASCHWDLRFAQNDHAEGWTVSIANPGIPYPILTLRAARELWKEQRFWKVNLKTGKIFPRRVETTVQGRKRIIVRPGNLFATRKATIVPKAWLDLEGSTPFPPDWPKTIHEYWDDIPAFVRAELRRKGWTKERARQILENGDEWQPPAQVPVGATRSFPGIFHIIEDGSYVPGARKPWFFEYLIEDGQFFSGRILFRLVRRAEKQNWDTLRKGDLSPDGEIVLPFGQEEEEAREPGYWLMMTADSADEIHPYVLSSEAVEDNWLPPLGVSALPVAFQKALPKEFRYWEKRRGFEEARQGAIEFFEELGFSPEKARKFVQSKTSPVNKKEEGNFRLVLQTFKKQFVIRFGPTTAIWWLLLELPDRKRLIALSNSPLKMDAVSGTQEELENRELIEAVEEDETLDVLPGTTLNPTKETPSRLELLDAGQMKITDQGPGFLKLDFQGKHLKGVWMLYEEEPGAGIFGFQKVRGPKVEKGDLQIISKNEEKQIAYGVVLSPEGPDAQGDVTPPEEIEDAAHNFLAFGGAIGLLHKGKPIPSRPVESYIAPIDFEFIPGVEESKVTKGTWILAVKIFDDQVWDLVKRGELTGFSIQGWGKRVPQGRDEK